MAMWALCLVSACREDSLPPPPIATSGPPPEPSQTSTDGGADETGAPPDMACDVWQQDCPPSYKCSPFDPAGRLAWTASRCVPIDPTPVALGDGCTMPDGPEAGIDDCPADALCYFADVRGQGAAAHHR